MVESVKGGEANKNLRKNTIQSPTHGKNGLALEIPLVLYGTNR